MMTIPEGIRSFGSAHRYYQGPGACRLVGNIAATLGSRAVLICDAIVQKIVEQTIREACEKSGVLLRTVLTEGEVTHPVIDRCIAEATANDYRPDLVIAAGGGKSVDSGKAVTHALGTALVVISTAASNDGPCSKNYVFYDDKHHMLSVEHLPRNPDAVIVDTDVLIQAPEVFLLSGIGDALTKLYEGDQCRLTNSTNSFGGVSTIAASVLAQACDRVIREDAVAGLLAARQKTVNPAFERLTEALVLLSGLAFENSGLSVAHSMTRGLPTCADIASVQHGLQVAYGLLVQFKLEGRDQAFFNNQLAFYRSIGLPTTLVELGAKTVTDSLLQAIAEGTMTSPHIKKFQRALSATDFVEAMREVELTR
jgi:glycerol dehydrogenase